MKKTDFTQKIPELSGLIIVQKLGEWEQTNDTWLGEEILVEHNEQQYLIAGLNNNPNGKIRVVEVAQVLVVKDKQTKGIGEKQEQS